MLLNVPGTLWENLGPTFDNPSTSSQEISTRARMDYDVSAHVMYDDQSQSILGYHSIYRDDTKQLLGVVNNRFPKVVQNRDAFVAFEPLMQSGQISIDTAMDLNNSAVSAAIFKINISFYAITISNIECFS